MTSADGRSREYQSALDFLYPRTQNYRFGLERTEALLDALGRPDRLFPVIHVGGTNGKGSVSTLVAEALEVAGWRTGLYTSPHLISFRERYRVNGVPITVGTGPVTIPLIIGSLRLNSTTTTPTSITRQAVVLDNLLTDLVLGEAKVNIEDNPCAV